MHGTVRILYGERELSGAVVIDSIDRNLPVIRHGWCRPKGKPGEQEYSKGKSHVCSQSLPIGVVKLNYTIRVFWSRIVLLDGKIILQILKAKFDQA
jgi:hypothetical protein